VAVQLIPRRKPGPRQAEAEGRERLLALRRTAGFAFFNTKNTKKAKSTKAQTGWRSLSR
jgi:hypothetical protein